MTITRSQAAHLRDLETLVDAAEEAGPDSQEYNQAMAELAGFEAFLKYGQTP